MKYLVLVAFMTIFASFSGAVFVSSAQEVRATSVPSWTFMVYLDADNSLSSYAADNLADMMNYGSNANLHIVVLYDSTEEGDSALYLIEHGKKELLKSLGEVDMGSGKTLQFFLNWTAENYPAQHYFLDLWDHGSYYHGVCLDHGDWLTLNEIDTALKYFDARIGHPLDVIGFDACRMGGIEIYYSLAHYAQYAVASEKDEPASGWPYYEVLQGIYGKNPEQAARAVADAMYDWAKKFYAENGLSVTMAAVNLTRIPEFVRYFNASLNEIMPEVPYYSHQLYRALQSAERYELDSVVDLYNLMQKIREIGDYKLNIFAENTMQWILNTTYSRAWDCPNPANGVHAANAHGMGIYAPLYFISGDYYYTAFAKETLWPRFLNNILSPVPVNGTGSAAVSLDNGTLTVNYSTDSSSVEIYVENATGAGSGLLKPSGNYSVNVSYGVYTVFVYGYNAHGMVNWVYRKTVDYLKTVTVTGRFYLNGVLLTGAKITLQIDNRTYTTIQNTHGFAVPLQYPREISNNSTIFITVQYGAYSWKYSYHLESLRGNYTMPVVIYARTFPPFWVSFAMAGIATVAVLGAMVLSRRRKIREK